MSAYGTDVDAICVHVSLDPRSLPAKPQPANRCPPPLNLRWDQFGLTSRLVREATKSAEIVLGRRWQDAKREPFAGNSFPPTQNTNPSSEMRRKICTVARKMLLEEGGGTQNTKCQPFSRNTSCLGTQNANHSPEIRNLRGHKTLTVQQK